MAISDVYDALTHQRCYKEAMSHEDSIKIIEEGAGKHFDPYLVELFLGLQDELQRIMRELDGPSLVARAAAQ